MKKFVLIILFSGSITIYAQESFYINPRIGLAHILNKNSNEQILGNFEGYSFLAEPDEIIDILFGYTFKSNISIESGIQYHYPTNRAHIYYEDLHESGLSFYRGSTNYLLIPVNLKYNLNIGMKKLKLISYIGFTYSMHKLETSAYNTYADMYSASYIREDDIIINLKEENVYAYRISNNNILLNSGLGLEYEFINKMALNLSCNYTVGYEDINKITVDVIDDGLPFSGDIFYKGDKIYLSLGLKLPISYYIKGFTKKTASND